MFSPRHTICFLSFFLLPSFCARGRAQSLLPESPVLSSLSSSLVASTQGYSFARNPAEQFADSIHPFRAALSYSPFVGGLRDATQSAAEFAYYSGPLSSSFSLGVTGLSYSDLYSDISLYGSYSKSFSLAEGRNASAGIRLRYETLSSTPAYPKIHFLIADLGFTLGLSAEFSLGGAALNLLGANYEIVSGETESLARHFLIGINYHPLNIPVKILTCFDEVPSAPLAIHFGAEYDPVAFLALRIGTSTDTGNICTGIGIIYDHFTFDAGSRFDKALGSIFSFACSGAW